MKKEIFIQKYPQLQNEWDYDFNGNIPDNLNQAKKFAWICNKQHNYQARLEHRLNGHGCPYCANQKAIINETDLMTLNPKLAKEWHPTKNDGLTPFDVTANSNRKVWWICKKGHEWQTTVCTRNHGGNCPYCANKKVLEGFNDLNTTHPDIAAEFDIEKNSLSSTQIIAGNNKKFWWICKKGHSFQSSCTSRCYNQTGCPICTNKIVLKGYNDLYTLCPEVAQEWDYDKNKLQPTDYTSKSNKKVWWKCKFNHSWEATIASRTGKQHVGCPTCAKKWHTSFPEQAIYYYIKQVYKDAINNDRHLGVELDVFIPSKNIAIEYDGEQWHQDLEKDIRKNKLCVENNITLYRIRENNCPKITDNGCYILKIYKNNDKLLEKVIIQLFSILKINIKINIEKDKNKILSFFKQSKFEKSFAKLYPQFLDEWDYDYNNPLLPDMITPNSGILIVWKCKKCNHRWTAPTGNRIKGCNCPKCGIKKRNRKVINIDNNVIYDSIKVAALENNCSATTIIDVCAGRKKHAGGYKWKYFDKE